MSVLPQDGSGPAVVAEGLYKRFGETQALDGVDLVVERAKVVGLLGPNGAGKTTAVRVFTTLIKPDRGRAFIDGIDVLTEPMKAKSRIGLTGQYAAVDERLTGQENLEHVGRLYHMPIAQARDRGRELLERFDLVDAADRIVKGYSGGMRRRLDIAMSLIARPSVLFLDEPTTGLDPRSRLAVWDLIEELVAGGTTTLLTTQYLDEAERLADEITVIDHGRVIAARHQRGAEEPGRRRPPRGHPARRRAGGQGAASSWRSRACGDDLVGEDHRTIIVPVVKVEGHGPRRRCASSTQAGIGLTDIAARQATLDDVFFALTGHGAEAAGEPEPREGEHR